MLFSEQAYWAHELLVQGSLSIKARGDYISIPINVTLRAGDIWDIWNGNFESPNRCEVERTKVPITCHICEGGHHIHIRWL